MRCCGSETICWRRRPEADALSPGRVYNQGIENSFDDTESTMKVALLRCCALLALLAAIAAPVPLMAQSSSDIELKRDLLMKRLKARAQNCARVKRSECVFACARSMSLLNEGKLQELKEEMKKCKAF